MAVAFDAVGPSSAGAGNSSSQTLSWTHTAVASNVTILVGCALDKSSDAGVTLTCTCDGVSMTALTGNVEADSQTQGFIQAWSIAGQSSGAHTILVTASSTGTQDLEGGSVSFTGAAALRAAVTNAGTGVTSSAVIGATASSSLIFGFTAAGEAVVSTTSPATSRFVNNQMGGGGFALGNAAGSTSPGGGSVTTAWGLTSSADPWAVITVEVRAPQAPPSPPVPLYAPGWFPGSAAVTDDPGGIPFYAQPAPTDATPALVIPPTPESVPVRPVPPGWFPGADRVTAIPGGMPFEPLPPPLNPTPAVVFQVPEVAGIADWLPLPPNWFPGASQITTDPGSIPFFQLPQPQIPPPAPPPVPTITGLAGTGYNGYFHDQNGNPRLLVLEQAWALAFNAGRWNSGHWQSDMDAYFTARARQGYTAWYGIAWGDAHVDSTALSGGRSWDGVYPLKINGTPGAIVTGSETVTLNDPFWQRIDYLFRSAAGQGIACFLNLGMIYDFDPGAIWEHLSTTQATAFGTALATRYPQAQFPNVFWFFGDDDNGPDNAIFSAMLSGITAAGDTRNAVSTEQWTNTNCHIRFVDGTAFNAGGFGAVSATYNWVYSYDPPYLGVEKSYTEGGTYTKIPPVYGDGVYYGDGSANQQTYTIRRFTWWALASGARGVNNTSGPSTLGGGGLWTWQSDAVSRLTSDPNGPFITASTPAISSYFTGLTGWHKLIPDTGNVFLTAGRGTKSTSNVAGNGFVFGDSDNYVAGSITADGSLAVLYCGQFMSVTIDQTKLGAGYTATWVDPATCATQTATTGSTYNSTPLGNNSAGNPDWVLVLQGPPVAPTSAGLPDYQPVPPGWFPGADRVTDLPGGVPFYVVPQPTDQNAPAAAGVTTATAALAGAGAVAVVVTEAPIATVAGAGAVAAVVTEAVTATAAGAGAVTALVTEAPIASLAGAGAVANTPATQAVTAALAGAGSITDVVTQAVIASLAGAGAVNASVAGGASTATITAAGSVVAVATQAATASLAGAGVVAATVTQRGAASLTGAGSLTAAGQITGTANLAAAGAVTAKAAQGAIAAPAGAGSLSALAAQAVTAALSGAGSVTAIGGTQVAFTVGSLTPSDAPAGVLTARDAPGGSGGVLTASDTRTGGPGG